MAGVPNADTIFNVVFFVVLTSVLVQGTTIPLVARRLGVDTDETGDPVPVSFDAVIAGDTSHNLHEVRIVDGARADGARVVELVLPGEILILLLRRGDTTMMP